MVKFENIQLFQKYGISLTALNERYKKLSNCILKRDEDNFLCISNGVWALCFDGELCEVCAIRPQERLVGLKAEGCDNLPIFYLTAEEFETATFS